MKSKDNVACMLTIHEVTFNREQASDMTLCQTCNKILKITLKPKALRSKMSLNRCNPIVKSFLWARFNRKH